MPERNKASPQSDQSRSTSLIDEFESAVLKVGLVGCSDAHTRLLRDLFRVAKSKAEVLLIGETGVGKERYSRFVHECSGARGEFVALNCGAMPDALFENELFGHSAGAYTDARARSDGLVQAAEGGTLFLDEVDRLAAPSQVKLLRLLQEREYRRLGEPRLCQANMRVISAMNSEPLNSIGEGRLREDLFYRLNVVAKRIPPLRERRNDIELLVASFTKHFSFEYGRLHQLRFDDAAKRVLLSYHWPGNIRQLENLIHSLTCEAPDESSPIGLESLEMLHRRGGADRTTRSGSDEQPDLNELTKLTFCEAKRIVVDRFERAYLCEMLRRANGNISQASRLAGKDRRAFFELLRKHNLDVENYKRNGQ